MNKQSQIFVLLIFLPSFLPFFSATSLERAGQIRSFASLCRFVQSLTSPLLPLFRLSGETDSRLREILTLNKRLRGVERGLRTFSKCFHS